ncbi:hypothetical protein ACQ0QQ_22350 [Lysinibacillus sphaericus]
MAKEDRQEAIDAWKAADIEAGFDLKKGPLVSVGLFIHFPVGNFPALGNDGNPVRG